MSTNCINDFKKAFQEEAFQETAFTKSFNSRYKILGEGNFGRVYRISCADDDDIAVKCIGVRDKKGLDRVKDQEVRCHKRCGSESERIVRFIDYVDVWEKDDKSASDEESSSNGSVSLDDADSSDGASGCFDVVAYALIFLQLVEGVELADYLRKNTDLSKLDQLVLFSEILEGVKHIHNKGIVHCDLKPENIMTWIDSSSGKTKIKIFDFGLSCDLSRSGYKIRPGSVGYASFEQEREGNPAVSFASDVHSLGHILLDLCGFDMRNRTRIDIDTYIKRYGDLDEDERPPFDNREWDLDNWQLSDLLSTKMARMVMKMLQCDPEDRPKLDNVIETVRNEINRLKTEA